MAPWPPFSGTNPEIPPPPGAEPPPADDADRDETPSYTSTSSVSVGDAVEYSYDDIPSGEHVVVRGIVVEIGDDGAYVAPLGEPAVIPLEQLQAL